MIVSYSDQSCLATILLYLVGTLAATRLRAWCLLISEWYRPAVRSWMTLSIHQINPNTVNSAVRFLKTYPLDIVRSKFSNTRCWFGRLFFNFFSSQVVRVSAYKGDVADDISKPSVFLCRHRTISTSESRLTTYYSSHILSMHLRLVYAVTKSISTLIFISLRLRSARTETRSTI